MARLQDSVIDQYGNAAPGATVNLYSWPVKALLATTTTDGNGFFVFGNVASGKYSLEVFGPGLTKRIIDEVSVFEPYADASQTTNGLMSAADKTKLDKFSTAPVINDLADVTISPPSNDDMLVYRGDQWVNLGYASSPYVAKKFLTANGGDPQYLNYVPVLNGDGKLTMGFLYTTASGGVSNRGLIPVTNAEGVLDPTLLNVVIDGGVGNHDKLPQLNPQGLLNNTLLNASYQGGANGALKVPLLDANGRLSPNMLPTSGGVYKSNLDLTVAYVAPVPTWSAGDYGYVSVTGPVHSSWVSHLATPVPATVKAGDNVIYNGTLYSVVPNTTDLSGYMPLDGSQAMTGPLTLKSQTGAGAVAPIGEQAISLAYADARYPRKPIAGDGGNVTQGTNKTTPVTLNRTTGQILTANSSLNPACMAGPRPARFDLNNTLIGADDLVVVQLKSGGTPGAYRVWCDSITVGKATLCIENISGAALAQALVLQFQVIKGAIS